MAIDLLKHYQRAAEVGVSRLLLGKTRCGSPRTIAIVFSPRISRMLGGLGMVNLVLSVAME